MSTSGCRSSARTGRASLWEPCRARVRGPAAAAVRGLVEMSDHAESRGGVGRWLRIGGRWRREPRHDRGLVHRGAPEGRPRTCWASASTTTSSPRWRTEPTPDCGAHPAARHGGIYTLDGRVNMTRAQFRRPLPLDPAATRGRGVLARLHPPPVQGQGVLVRFLTRTTWRSWCGSSTTCAPRRPPAPAVPGLKTEFRRYYAQAVTRRRARTRPGRLTGEAVTQESVVQRAARLNCAARRAGDGLG